MFKPLRLFKKPPLIHCLKPLYKHCLYPHRLFKKQLRMISAAIAPYCPRLPLSSEDLRPARSHPVRLYPFIMILVPSYTARSRKRFDVARLQLTSDHCVGDFNSQVILLWGASRPGSPHVLRISADDKALVAMG